MAGDKSVRLLLLGDNRDAKAKIDEIEAKGEELAAKHPELKIGIDTAVAAEKLRILRAELKETKAEGDKLDFGGAATGVAALGGSILGLSAALPVLASVGAGVVGVSAAVGAGAVGLGIFGAVAKSVFTTYKKNIDAVAAAQERIANGDTGKALAADNAQIEKATKGLGSGITNLVFVAANAKLAWHSFIQESSNGVANTLAPAIRLIPVLLSQASRFLPGVESALSGIIAKLGKGLSSKGFVGFIGALSREAPIALTKVAGILGHLGSIGGKVVEALLPLGNTILKDIDAFLAKADAGAGNGIQKFLGFIADHGKQVADDAKNLAQALERTGKSLVGLSGVGIAALTPLTGLIRVIASNPIGADALAGLLVLSKLGGLSSVASAVVTFGKGLKILATSERAAAVASALFEAATGPVGLALLGISAVTLLVVTHWKTFKKIGLEVFHAIEGAVKSVFGWVKGHWPLLLGILAGPIGLATAFVVTHWRQIENGAKRMTDNVIGFFKSLPRRILNALGDLGSLLWNAGISILSGLLGGLLQKWNDVTHFISGIGSWIAAHKGPIDVDAVLLRPHGRAIMSGLVGGLQDGMPGLTRQLSTTTNVIASTRIPAALGTTGGAPLQVEWIGGPGADQEFITWLKKHIRFRGGDPGVLGR